MSDIVGRLRATLTDKDNMPRMNSETWLPVGLAREAADEIERLRSLVDSECKRAEAAHGEAQRLALDVERLRAALMRIAIIGDRRRALNPKSEEHPVNKPAK